MLVKDSIKYSYNDIAVMPAKISTIKHRKETNPYYFDGMLPIFTAPMSSIVNEDNISTYLLNHINVVIPRNINIKERIRWMVEFNCFAAMSMQEARKYLLETPTVIKANKKMHLCIDVANGHMQSLYDLVKELKARYKNLVIMTGNIANPETIEYAINAGVDYIRIGIGTGAGCFIDGTKIKTKLGIKPIEQICNGDYVLTIDGTYQKVINTVRYKSNKLIKINNEIISTRNHQFFVINKEDKDKVNENNLEKYGYWVNASCLNKQKHLLIKKY